ncbi:MAG: type I DNA topoisomerase [Flavobacteriales bacterium]|nr:type I DNA topoisomerase [Flavobacteriales bacterium]MCB9197751.1 type I DNA topoisomerase [Flavobacteriales bacterium]
MAENLVIVESPAKAKTIEGYLGKGYIVKSSFGHVRDLPKKGINIDIENNFSPKYEVTPDKKKVVKELKDLSKKANMVWLATDEDREGEAISWHLVEALGLTQDKIKRITFNEITKTAVTRAIENPRTIDVNLVNAQQARRVLDRIVGFELSPVLWKKVKPSLSAGRVQSVTVRLIVEREREIQSFIPTSSYKVYAYFLAGGSSFRAELPSNFETEAEANSFLEKCKNAKFSVENLEKKPGKRTPAVPFTTSTLQQEASRKLGFSVSRTMSVAQKLYESGKITYMRTDSVNLSDFALANAKEAVIKIFGGDYCNPRKYQNKNANAQEAHEAIRPTDFSVQSAGSDNAEKRLYDLIWKRTIASQMSDAELERTKITIDISSSNEKFIATGEIIKFDGFLKVYLEGTDDEDQDDNEGLLPKMEIGEELKNQSITATERYTRPKARYTEASLVKQLEEKGIGRPSTYAPTISTVQKRGYVEKKDIEGQEREFVYLELKEGQLKRKVQKETYGADRNKLIPTDMGMVVTDFLVENFNRILDYNFTATVEKEFDDIANGLMEWTKMLDKFYKPFHHNIEDTLENSDRATGERELGTDPVSGRPIIARIGRFGPMIQIGKQEDEEKPKFASLKSTQSINSITLEEALDLFKLPKDLGIHDGLPVSANVGRFGPYVRHGNSFVSIPKGTDPLDITLTEAIELIETKKQEDANKFIAEYEDPSGTIQVLNGRYGPYIKQGKKNFKIPKDKDANTLSKEDCLHIMANQPAPKGRRKK